MNKKLLLFIVSMIMVTAGVYAKPTDGYPETNRSKENIDLDWKFEKNNKLQPISVDFDDSKWENVSLPHNPDPISEMLDSVSYTWEQKTFMRDHNWYRKKMIINLDKNEKAFIQFEGVHNKTRLWMNGKYVGLYDVNGYIPFDFDITEFVIPGKENTIVVDADNSFDPTISPDPFETDYVKWGGIFRDVYLVKTNKLHVNFNWENKDAGVYITTPMVKKRNGTVSVKTTVVNEYDKDVNCLIKTMIINENGRVLKKLNKTSLIKGLGQQIFRQTVSITDDYHLWSPDVPYLYRVVSIIYMNNKPVDIIENRFGFRSLKLVDGQGLFLNGEPFFMVGVNRHQSFPNIGDAVPNSMHYQEALRYKNAGINAIRLSHYPQDDAFIDACDELGIFLYEEPSTWIKWSTGVWMDKLVESARVMVRNHRNHPSIAIWGAGVNHRGPVPKLNSAIKEEDPIRFTASASSAWCGIKNAGVTDIYATMDYRRSSWPEGDFCMVMENGFSDNALAQQFHISRYKKRKNNIGALLWVGADYNRLRPTEKEHDMVTVYGLQTSYRIPRPAYFWYKSENSKVPFVHIADQSVYKNDKIYVYSNAPKVALYADDKLVAIQRNDNDPLRIENNHPSFTFTYHWTDEKLTAKALFDGKECATFSRSKVIKPYALKVAVDFPDMKLVAGGSDLKMIRAYIVDKNGEVITDASNIVHFEVQGAGSIVYSGKSYVDNTIPYHGVASVYLKGNENPGKITIKAISKGLKSSTLKLESVAFQSDELLEDASPIYDFLDVKVDLDAKENLTQHDWRSVRVADKDSCKFTIGDSITCDITGDGDLKWKEGALAIMGDLPWLGADGLYVDKGTIGLSIKGLSKGIYELRSYHNAIMNISKYCPFDIDVVRQDADGVVKFVADDMIVMYSDPKDLGERKPMSVVNVIKSDGSEINISFKVDKKNGPTFLNGFELKRIK